MRELREKRGTWCDGGACRPAAASRRHAAGHGASAESTGAKVGRGDEHNVRNLPKSEFISFSAPYWWHSPTTCTLSCRIFEKTLLVLIPYFLSCVCHAFASPSSPSSTIIAFASGANATSKASTECTAMRKAFRCCVAAATTSSKSDSTVSSCSISSQIL